MRRSFVGAIDISPPDFTLIAERFIVGDGSVSFCLQAEDTEDGRYSMEGEAHETRTGSFVSPILKVLYERAKGDFDAMATFSQVLVENDTCTVRGQWLQDGEAWDIAGVLRPYAA
jgi:hypothetical protein